MTLQGADPWKHQDGQLATAEIIKGLAEGKVCASMHAMSVLPLSIVTNQILRLVIQTANHLSCV